MATKSQLKEYFETGKIPTQAQFGNLIDSIFNIIGSPDGSLNINSDENNIKLSIKNYRSLHGMYMSQLSVSLHLFFNNDIKNGTKPVPVFIIFSIVNNLTNSIGANIKYAVPNVISLKSMTDDKLDYLTASLDVIIQRFAALRITYYDLVPKEEEVKKPSIVTIMYTDSDHTTYVCNCIMGMWNINSIVPICIYSLIKLHDVENDNYSGGMSILQRTVYNNITIESEWEKIMELQGYKDGLVIDNSGVAENFMTTVYGNYYTQIQLRS
nr:MAG TPA: hypothetical protein [Herelleviridae sp.]